MNIKVDDECDFDPLSIDPGAVNEALTGCRDCEFVAPEYFSIDEARDKVLYKLQKFLRTTDLVDMDDATTFESIGLTGSDLRKFELKFYTHSDMWVTKDVDGNTIYRDENVEDVLPPVPPSIGEFISKVYNLGKNSGFLACNLHY